MLYLGYMEGGYIGNLTLISILVFSLITIYLLWALIFIFWEGFRHQYYIHFVPRKILYKMDPYIACRLFLKNDYQTPNTLRKHLDHSKKKKNKKNFFPQNGLIRRENRSRNFFGKKKIFLGLGRFFEVDLGQKKVKNFFFIFRLQMAQFVQKTGF